MNDPVIQKVQVRCSRAHAFEVFTGKLNLWWPPSHRRSPEGTLTLEGRTGGRFFERAQTGEERELGEVTVWEPPARVVYTWYPGAPDRPTLVEVLFEDRDQGTLVEVRHHEGDSGLGERWPDSARGFTAAWNHVLPAFTDFVAKQKAT